MSAAGKYAVNGKLEASGLNLKKLFGGQQLVDGVFDGEEIGRFFDDNINGRAVVGRISGAHDHGCGGRFLFDDLGQFPAGHAWHGVVRQNQIMQDGTEAGEGFAGGICGINFVAKIVQKHLGQQTSVKIVVNQQDGSGCRL